VPGEARNTRRRTEMGHGGDEASKRVGGILQEREMPARERAWDGFGPCSRKRARRGRPVSR